ncbi:MAG: hypothetical protein IKQ68_08630 [Prevotella sp.]|nr:hypothetical protein [Prevotella sp.]
MKNIIFVAALLMSLTVRAQVNPREGFIITNQKDTVYGMIDYRTNDKNSQQCTFKADNASEYVTYAPGQIAGYRFKDSGKYYVSRDFGEDGVFFAEFLVNGMMNLYRREVGYRKIYYLENENGEVVRYENFDEHLDYDEREAKVRAQGLVSQVYKSQRAVDDVKFNKMSDKQMIKMVKDYHEDVCTSGDDCIQYEYDARKEGRISVRPTVYVGGGYAACYDKDVWSKYYKGGGFFTIGAGIDLDRSRYGTGMMFQLSCLYSRYTDKDNGNHFSSLSFNLGPMFRFGAENSVRFTARAGLAFDGFTSSITDGYSDLEKNFHTTTSFLGIYGGCGIELPIGKHAVNFNIEYRSLSWTEVGIFQGTIGFRI